MKIITNNIPRDLLAWHDLSEAEQAIFDYMSPEQADEATFVRFRNYVYSLADFMRCDADGWDGYQSESFFSGILLKLIDSDTVLMGRYCS